MCTYIHGPKLFIMVLVAVRAQIIGYITQNVVKYEKFCYFIHFGFGTDFSVFMY